MKDGMRVLIARDGSAHADAALGDLRRAGLPREGRVLTPALLECLHPICFPPGRLRYRQAGTGNVRRAVRRSRLGSGSKGGR